MSNVTLREITNNDFQFLYSLLFETMNDYYVSTYGRWDDEIEKNYLTDEINQYPYFIIIADEEPVGCISLKESDNRIFINELLILPNYQNKGIGTYILKNIIQSNYRNKIIELEVLSVNIKAIKLYKRIGFTSIKQNDTHITMRYNITQ